MGGGGHIFGILRYFDDEKLLVYRVPMLIAICSFFCFKRKKKFCFVLLIMGR